jgi:hypothetical protein
MALSKKTIRYPSKNNPEEYAFQNIHHLNVSKII